MDGCVDRWMCRHIHDSLDSLVSCVPDYKRLSSGDDGNDNGDLEDQENLRQLGRAMNKTGG
jgi:hypothetical protein